MRGCFVTGTDTGVGKTVLAAVLTAGLRAGGARVRVLKPVLTGLEERPPPEWPHDHELLARAAGCEPGDVAMYTFGPPVSPHLAERLSGRAIDPDALRSAVAAAADDADAVIVEGVGGLLVPLTSGYDVARLAGDAGLPLVIAARPGLGTINHTLLTLEAARSRGLSVAAVVLTPWPEEPDAIETSNRETIAALGSVAVATLHHIVAPEYERLVTAAEELAIDAWVGAEAHRAVNSCTHRGHHHPRLDEGPVTQSTPLARRNASTAASSVAKKWSGSSGPINW